jgi:glycosyltransferase involved in cell wall biosynthesis
VRRTRILVLSRSIVGSRMSAPGIRAYHMAQVLGRQVENADVTLGVPAYSDVEPEPGFRVEKYTRLSSILMFYRYDVIISLGFPPMSLPAFFSRVFVLDFFSNFAMEWMEVGKTQRNYRKRWTWYETARQYINYQLTAADFIICNNERQRDAWLGMLQGLGLITGEVYDADNSLRRLVAVAPHGIRPEEGTGNRGQGTGNRGQGTGDREQGTGNRGQGAGGDGAHPAPGTRHSALRRIPGIRSTDIVLLWNAGIVGWYDPVTAIRAVHAIAQERDDVKLVFMGSKYPDPGFLEENPTFKAAIETAEELGVTDNHVFFVRGWLPYEEVKGYLLDSYLGLSTYFNNAETHYSHRTRFVDLIWAELPIVCTRGDILSEMVEQEGLGIVVAEGDVDAVVTALERLLDDRDFYERCRANLRALKPTMTWDHTLSELVAYCRDPRPIAVPKARRVVPLLRRTAGYLFWRAAQKLVV